MRPNERIVRLADLLSELSDVNRNMELPGCRISLIGLLKGTSGRIEHLDLSNNLLQRLDGIEQLAQLRTLDLRNNKIADQRELLRLGKCKHLRRVFLEGNPFVSRQLTLAARELLEQYDHDLTLKSTVQIGFHKPTTEELMADNYMEECFLESVFRKLDLHTQFTNEFTIGDYSQRDYAWLLNNRCRFMQSMTHMREDYQEIAKEQLLELQRRHSNSHHQLSQQLLREQRQRIEELTALVLKKSEILANLRRMGEKNAQFTLSQESQSHSTLQMFIEDQDESMQRVELHPLVNRKALKERSEDNFASLSSSNFRSKGQTELQYRMINSQLISDSNLDNLENEYKLVKMRAPQLQIKQPSKVAVPKRPVQKNAMKHPVRQMRELQIAQDDGQSQRLRQLQQLLEEQKTKLAERERELRDMSFQLEEKTAEASVLEEACKQKEEKVRQLSENIQMVHQISQNNENDYQQLIDEQEKSLALLREQKQLAESSVEALIATEKNQEILMLAKQASLQRRYFDLMLNTAQRLQALRVLRAKTERQSNSRMRRKIFDVFLTNLIVKRMHDRQRRKLDRTLLQTAFQGLQENAMLQAKCRALAQLRRRSNFRHFASVLRIVSARKAEPLEDKRIGLRQFTLKTYSFDALKLYAHEQGCQSEQQTNLLNMQLNAYRVSLFFYRLARQSDERSRLASSMAVLQYELKVKRLEQLKEGARRKWPQLAHWANKLRRIAYKTAIKRCFVFRSRQQLELTNKRKALTALALRGNIANKPLGHQSNLLVDNLRQYRIRCFFQQWTIRHLNNPKRKAELFSRNREMRLKVGLLQKVVWAWQCELWKQRYENEHDKVQNVEPLMTELREREMRIIKLEAVWKEELRKKDERIGLYEKKFEEVSYDIIEKDLRYEKLKAIYENALEDMQQRQTEFMSIIAKFQAAEEASTVAYRNRLIYEEAKFGTAEAKHVQVSEFSLSKHKTDRT